MKLYDVSQLVVFDAGRIVGIIDESNLSLAVHEAEHEFRRPVRDSMTTRLFTVRRARASSHCCPSSRAASSSSWARGIAPTASSRASTR